MIKTLFYINFMVLSIANRFYFVVIVATDFFVSVAFYYRESIKKAAIRLPKGQHEEISVD
jgi:hypothetical protein